MANITRAGWEKAIRTGADNSVLRISKHTGDVTTARHGFFSRLVRWVHGPTRQDRDNNRAILEFAQKRLKKSYGRAFADWALRFANDPYRPAELDPEKPLSVRQVRTAHELARGRVDDVVDLLDNAIPTRALRAVEHIESEDRESQQGPKLEGPKLALLCNRLTDEMRAAAIRQGNTPASERVAIEIAGNLREQVVELTADEVNKANGSIARLRNTAQDLFDAMIQGRKYRGSPIALLSEMIRQSDDLAGYYADPHEEEEEEDEVYAYMHGSDDPGSRQAAWRAIEHAMSSVNPGPAREHFESALRDGSEARRVYAAIARGAQDPKDEFQAHAGDELDDYFRHFLDALGARTGIPENQRNKDIGDLVGGIRDDVPHAWDNEDIPIGIRSTLRDYEEHIEERGQTLYRQWADDHPAAARRRLNTAVKRIMRNFNPVRNTRGFRDALRARGVEAVLTPDQRRVVHERLEFFLRRSGSSFPEHNQIAVLVAEIARKVATMDDLDVAAELKQSGTRSPTMADGRRYAHGILVSQELAMPRSFTELHRL